MRELRWGILATGSIARSFARDLRGATSGRLVAVGSRSSDSARRFASDFEVARAHGSYEELLADPDVDAVYIATPHPMHATWAVRAAAAGKHVLCEKPLAMTASEAATIFDAAAAHGVFAMEAFMYRCHPQTDALVALLRDGVVGDVREVEAVHSFDGGARLDPAGRLLAAELGGGGILDVGCYCVSGAALVAGAPAARVTGEGDVGPTGVDVRASATVEYENGVVAHLRCGISDSLPPLLRVTGSAGTITLNTPWLPTIDGDMTSRITIGREGEEREVLSVAADRGLYAYEAGLVAACVARGEHEAPWPAPTWDDTVRNMAVLDEWRRAVGVTYPGES